MWFLLYVWPFAFFFVTMWLLLYVWPFAFFFVKEKGWHAMELQEMVNRAIF
jgi:hypothetical protein